jgi:hypothetical protein
MRKGSTKITLPNGKKITQFEHKWGINAIRLAELEEVTPDAIHMRVQLYGTPFQRRAKPTLWENKYGKTLGQMALETGLHPITLANKHYKFGDVYAETDQRFARGKHTKVDWWLEQKYKRMIKSTFFKLEDII